MSLREYAIKELPKVEIMEDKAYIARNALREIQLLVTDDSKIGKIITEAMDDWNESYDNEMQKRMNDHILKMVDLFSEEGHSGTSASYAISRIARLLRFKPLSPLTGEDDEWDEYIPGKYQNRRFAEVFKDGKDGEAYWMNGKVFSYDGETWYTNKDSNVYIDFPFNVPDKPEYIVLRKTR